MPFATSCCNTVFYMGTKYDPSTFGLRCLPGSSLPGRICSSFNLLPCWVYCNTEQSPSSPGTTSPIWIDSFFGTIGPGIWYGEDIGPFYSLAMMIQSTFLVVDSAGFSKAWYIQDIPSSPMFDLITRLHRICRVAIICPMVFNIIHANGLFCDWFCSGFF